jgi:hypothetical protein
MDALRDNRRLAHSVNDEHAARARAVRALSEARVPFLVAGAYAYFEYTGTCRETKDLDLCLMESDLPRAFNVLEAVGFHTELLDPRWLGKAYSGDQYIDLIFSSGNGVTRVDELWFVHAKRAAILGQSCEIVPVEEMIWSKAFVNERERYDGADVNHLIYACGDELDWVRLLDRFASNWEVLFAHLILYRFTYPSARSKVPSWVIDELCARIQAERHDHVERVCRGHLISGQYQGDYDLRGFVRDRTAPSEVADAAPLAAQPHLRQQG